MRVPPRIPAVENWLSEVALMTSSWINNKSLYNRDLDSFQSVGNDGKAMLWILFVKIEYIDYIMAMKWNIN